MNVDFLIAGTQKGGTSALNRYLREHQDLLMASTKEVHFFDTESHFEHKPDYSTYHAYFDTNYPGYSKNVRVGEATPIYMYWYDAAKRIWEYNPQMQLIIILRNPIERAFSHWNMERDAGHENLSFSEAITIEEHRCKTALPLQHRIFSYVDRGFYCEQLRRIWHYFPRKQTLVIKNEDLRNDVNGTLKKIAGFLNLSEFPLMAHSEIHSRKYVSSMNDNERSILREIYFNEIKELEHILGWDCSNWLE